MLETDHEDTPFDPARRYTAHRLLTIVLHISALLLGSGASTNDVATTIQTLAEAAGLQPADLTVIADWSRSHGTQVCTEKHASRRPPPFEALPVCHLLFRSTSFRACDGIRLYTPILPERI
jgi:hypothetical protein